MGKLSNKVVFNETFAVASSLSRIIPPVVGRIRAIRTVDRTNFAGNDQGRRNKFMI